MVVFSLNILNKDGGLVYHKEFSKAQRVDLRLASSFHVMSTIACQIAPVPKSSGIEEFVAEAFKLQCMQTRTGVKFYFITDPAHPASVLKALLQQCYECYVDYVLKNPFHAIDQPIRCEKFDFMIDKLIAAAPQQ
jgi:hypothetical protein